MEPAGIRRRLSQKQSYAEKTSLLAPHAKQMFLFTWTVFYLFSKVVSFASMFSFSTWVSWDFTAAIPSAEVEERIFIHITQQRIHNVLYIYKKAVMPAFSILLQTVSALLTWNIWSCGGRCRWLNSCDTLDFSHFNIFSVGTLCELHFSSNILTRWGWALDRWARGIVGRRTVLFNEHVGVQRLTPAICS